MATYICMHCGEIIMRHALSDPFVCRDCEKVLDGAESEDSNDFLSRTD
ncbi:MAG TPA: hypothetical protein VI564_07570 [Candidatus Nanoarchaeia archaeon]|nr:hypothetical protein [Candidatus Nanoarchaeia archaeon]